MYTSSPVLLLLLHALSRSFAASTSDTVWCTPGASGAAVPHVSLAGLGAAGTNSTWSVTSAFEVPKTYSGYAPGASPRRCTRATLPLCSW